MKVSLPVVIALLLLDLSSCGDPTLDLVRANPMSEPTLPFGEITSQNSLTGSTSTGLSASRLDTRNVTVFEVSPDRVDEAFDELVAQAEAHGYAFEHTERTSGFREALGGASEYPWTPVKIWHTEKTVLVEVIGIRPERRAGS